MRTTSLLLALSLPLVAHADIVDLTWTGGTLTAPLDQDYCWMWSNRSQQPVDIEIKLTQARPAK